jgi:hypothetical protein
LKWEAGRQYVMQQDGFTIREVSHNFTITPSATDDSTKGFAIDSRWILDNGDIYVCTDATEDSAVWELQVTDVQDLQNVTDIGNTTTNSIQVADLDLYDSVNEGYSKIQVNDTSYIFNDYNGNPVKIFDAFGLEISRSENYILQREMVLTANRQRIEPDKDGTYAMLDDIPPVTGFVPYTGANANVDLGEYELKAGQIELDTTPTGTAGVAVTRWNNTIGSSETTLKGGNVILKNGVDLVARVVNKVTPNTTLTKASYQVVRISGAQGQRLAVNLAQANNDNNSADTLGVVCETIATNQEGFIMTVGQLENINTTGSLQGETWVDGDVLYLSPTIAGRITNVKPVAPAHIVIIGYVEYAHANNGKIYVKVMNGWELDELHNVAISTPLNNQGLIYESATDLWKNRTIIQDSITDGVTTIAPSQNAVFDALNLKTDKTSWIDISATSTIVGWSSFTARFIFYKIIDGYCFIDFQLEGTSNSATTTFTMPFNSTSGFTEFRPSGYNVNNGSVRENAGRIGIVNNSNVVVLSASLNGNNYTASGIKASYGQISFKIN